MHGEKGREEKEEEEEEAPQAISADKAWVLRQQSSPILYLKYW